MAFWDFIKQLHLNDAEEKRRQQRGGFLNSVYGAIDNTGDMIGDAGKRYIDINKKGVGVAAGLAREFAVKPVVSVIASAEERQQDSLKRNQLDLINKLKDIKPEDREAFIKDNPVLQNRFKDGKLTFSETTDPWLFGNIFRDKKTMAEVDVKDNSALERLTAQINEKDAANDKGRQATNIIDRQIFGNEPIQAYQNREAGLEKAGWSKPMAIAGTGANVLLDSPLGGGTGSVVKSVGKEGIEQLAKTGTREGVEALLKGKVSKEVLDKISQTIANTTDTKVIRQVLDQTDSSILKRARSGKTAGQIADDVVSKVKPTTQGTDNLINDFVNAADPNKLTPDTPTVTPPVEKTAPKTKGVASDSNVLKSYAGNDFTQINTHVKGRTLEQMDKRVRDKVEVLDRNMVDDIPAGTYYRGMVLAQSEIDNMVKTGKFKNDGYSSTSTDVQVADKFTHSRRPWIKDEKPVIFQLDVKDGQKGIDLTKISKESARDNEKLLPRNAEYIIKNVSEVDGKYIVDAEYSTAPRTKGVVPDPKNYKTVEDFIKAHGDVLYHGSPNADKILASGFDTKYAGTRSKHSPEDVGIHFTESKRTASAYSEEYLKGVSPLAPKGAGTIEAVLGIKKPLLVDQSKEINAALIKKAKADGYDGIIAGKNSLGEKEREFVVFDPKQIKTKQELTEIYNKNLNDQFNAKLAEAQATPPKPLAPKTPPVGRLSKEEEDFLGSFHSTSEIDKMGPKKGVASKINEQTFDKNAPLTAFKEAYKQNTGQDLPTDFDPKAIMQLSNGNDAAAKLQLEPVTRALSGTKNLDDVRMLGMARHILSRRETLPTETVARAEAVLNNMQSRLGRDFAKTEEAVGTVIKFNQDQLQRLVDAEIISPESYKYLQEANPNYFSNMGLVDHILNDTTASKAFGASGSHNRSRENIIKAVRGFEDDSRAEFRDPIENIARTAAAVQKAVKDRELFNAIGEFEKIDPKLAFKQRISENVLKRMNLSLDNQELRPVRDKLDRMMRTRQMWVKKLQTESNNLEKKAYQTSLKEGGQSMPKFTPEGLGGAVPTSKATNKVVAQTPGEEQLMKAMGSPDGMPTPLKLGPQDTQAFLRSLVEGSPAKIERLRKQINTRDVNAHRILDEIDGMRSEYDDTVQRIISNSEEAKQLMDKELPKGMKAITSMKNGIQERIAVPEEIHAIYSGMNKAQQDVVNTTAKKMLQFTKESLTTYNPAFALVTNPIRDIAQSAFISKEVPLKDYLLVVPYAKRWLESFWGTLRQDSVFRAVNAAGGGNSGQFVDNLDPEKYAKQIEKRVHGKRVLGINSGVVVKNPADFLKLMAKVSVSPVIGAAKVIKKVGTTVEATTRGVEARAVKARGGSVKEAALGNRTVSTDFLEGGKSAQVVNNFLPFFNARLQGTRNVVKAIKENPKRASVLIGAGIGVPTATAYAWNMSNYKDEYEQVDQSVKDNNFVIFFGKGVNAKDQPNQFITIPKNDIQRFFSNPIENALRALNDDDPESFGVIATKMLSGTLPIDVAKDGKLNASRTVGSILPPVPKAAVQYVTNKNLYNDSPLVPDNLKGLPPEEQVRETTSPIDSFIAKIIPGQQSPIKVNAVRSAISGNTIRNPIDSLASPLTASANAPTSEFYSILNKTSQKHDSASKKINEALARGDSMEARKIADEYNEGLKAAFRPWADKFGDKQTPELIDLYNKQKINLTKKSIKQRQTNIRKKASLANQ